jgi:hypothetical protein
MREQEAAARVALELRKQRLRAVSPIAFWRRQPGTKLIDLTSETERLPLQHGQRVASVAMLHQLGYPFIEGGKLAKEPVKLMLDW